MHLLPPNDYGVRAVHILNMQLLPPNYREFSWCSSVNMQLLPPNDYGVRVVHILDMQLLPPNYRDQVQLV